MSIAAMVDRALIAAGVRRSRAELERELETARGALTEVLCYVEAELDPNCDGPWSGYVTGDDRRALVDELAAEHSNRPLPTVLEVIR